mmetsp:Transcript_825/g.1706  ORF Transcript_825/g.1706 Transcript_825/m.1706 type:complete len:1233 (+) Transcript_825:106-3804(+)
MDNVIAPRQPGHAHDFSQSSIRSVTNHPDDNNVSHYGLDLEVEEYQPLQLQQPFEQQREDDDEEANTQETFTQHEMTQGNELTQLGVDDDDIDAVQSQDCNSPTPIDPLTLPWGRLMPVGSNVDSVTAEGGGGNNAAPFPPRPSSSRGATEMLPRSPTRAGSIATRSRSPSVGGGDHGNNSNGNQHHSSPPCIHFLGLKNLLPSDRFNEYVLGRSIKADAIALKMDVPTILPAQSDPETQQRNDTKRKRNDYVHAMISNRHCRIYCLLSNCNNSNRNNSNNNGNGPPEMEVFVEDTSGNGTLVNGTTLLRRNERRKLHTGDVICLLNPKLLSKKMRSVAERKMYMSQYSYVFVNLYEQEARHGWGVMSGRGNNGGDLASPVSTSKKMRVVNVRATKCHSVNANAKSKRSLFSSTTGNGEEGMMKSNQQQPSSKNNNNNKPSSLGSFLNNPRHPSSKNNNTSTTANHRRIEEEYDLRDLLGTGTCGEVRRAIHRRTGEERAVKIISIGARGGAPGGPVAGHMSSEKLTAIRAEAEILRSLDHPYVVKLFDMFISPGKAIYLVMELIRGGDLFDRIVERERYTEVQARRLFRRILTAVHYLHEDRGIVHRDLKPENILVVDRRSDVNIKLTDFGLAKNMTAEGLKTFCGTPQYFAPEVLRRRHTVKGDGRYGKEIDCWSIGVILFILLSGSPPFDVSAGFDAVANAKVVFYEDQWKYVSKEARDLVMRLLEKDPRKRMSVKDACGHAWVLVEDGDTHCHPLHDPVVAKYGPAALSAKASDGTSENNVAKSTRNDDKSRNADGPAKPPSSPCRKICAPVDANANALSPISTHDNKMNNQQNKFQSKSAPQLSKDGRRPSIWPAHGNDKTVTKAIQQACHTSQPSPNGSPIQKRQLFNAPVSSTSANNNDSFARKKKMTKQGVESINAAGNTLPTPVINKESRLIKKVSAPKKKVQSTLFPTADATKQQGKASSERASQLPENKSLNNKRKSSNMSTVTPPGNEQNSNGGLVFRLNKKHKVGDKKYISPEARENAATTKAAVAPAKNAELSEDELQSDFSDDDDVPAAAVAGRSPQSEKKPLEKYLQKKRKMDSIESAVSVDIGSKPQSTTHGHRKDKSQKNEPRPVSKSSLDEKTGAESPPAMEDKQKPNDLANCKDRKLLVQTFLFGKPPMEANVPANNDGSTNEDDPSQSNQMQGDGTTSLQRQSTGESIGGVSNTAPKGKQRSIKSWFQPKK